MPETDGVRFQNESDRRASLKDAKIIEELKKKYDLHTREGVQAVYRELQNLNLSSPLGRQFDDEVYELYLGYRNGTIQDTAESGKTKPPSKKKSKEAKLPAGKEKQKQKSASVKEVKEEKIDPEVLKEVEKILRRQNRRRNLLIILMSLISLGCLGYFGNYMIKADQAEREAQALSALKDTSQASFISVSVEPKKQYDETVVIPDILDEYKVLYNKNKSLIGWIKIADTKIDYPVMQTLNNEYYLKHNFDQEEDANGSIFMDCDCDVITGCDNFILYGHHMKSGKMFAPLVKYANEDFYKEHKYIQFDTIYEKGTYEVMYAFRTKIYKSDEITFKYYQFINANSEAEFDSAMEEMAAMSLIDTGVTASYGDQLLTLSTCDYQETNGRFAVVAKKID